MLPVRLTRYPVNRIINYFVRSLLSGRSWRDRLQEAVWRGWPRRLIVAQKVIRLPGKRVPQIIGSPGKENCEVSERGSFVRRFGA